MVKLLINESQNICCVVMTINQFIVGGAEIKNFLTFDQNLQKL